VLLKVRNPGMQGNEFLRPVWVLEANLAPLLLPCRPMRLFNQVVVASSGDDLDVLHSMEHEEFSNGCSVAPEFVGVNYVWYVVIH